MNGRRLAWLGFGGLAALLGGCQLVSGLSSYQESGSTATGAGGGASSSGVGGDTTASVSAGSAGVGGSCATCGNSSVCIDVDAVNCGTCGKVCGVLEACASGKCVANGPYAAVTAISVNTKAAYWASTKGLFTTLHTTDPATWTVSPHELSLSTTIGGLAIADDGKSVFFTLKDAAAPGLYRWIPGDSSPKLLSTEANLGEVGGVVRFNDVNVAWVGKTKDSTWHVFGKQIDGQAPSPAMLVYPTTMLAPLAAVEGRAVYWPDPPYFRVQDETFDQDSTHQVSDNLFTFNPSYLAVDPFNAANPSAGYLYWIVDPALHRVPKAALTSDKPDPIFKTAVYPAGLVADGAFVSWLSSPPVCVQQGGKLMTAGEASWAMAATIRQAGLECPGNLAEAGGFFYYSDGVADHVKVTRLPVMP